MNKELDEKTKEILEDCFGRFCSQCIKDSECIKIEHGTGCNERVKPLKYKCITCMSYKGCALAWKATLPCLDYKDYPEGVYNNDGVVSKEYRIGEPQHDTDIRKMMSDMIIIRKAIRVKHPEGKEFVEGTMECPICGKKRWYMISDHYNGHIHSKCETENCINWME